VDLIGVFGFFVVVFWFCLWGVGGGGGCVGVRGGGGGGGSFGGYHWIFGMTERGISHN